MPAACTPSACRATGRGLQPKGVRVRETADFRVLTKGAGTGDLRVLVKGPSECARGGVQGCVRGWPWGGGGCHGWGVPMRVVSLRGGPWGCPWGGLLGLGGGCPCGCPGWGACLGGPHCRGGGMCMVGGSYGGAYEGCMVWGGELRGCLWIDVHDCRGHHWGGGGCPHLTHPPPILHRGHRGAGEGAGRG